MSDSFYCVLRFQKGQQLHNFGILLYDASRKKLWSRFLEKFGFTNDEADLEILAELPADLMKKSLEREDPIWIFDLLEDTASNTIQISERYPVVGHPEAALERAYKEQVEPRLSSNGHQ